MRLTSYRHAGLEFDLRDGGPSDGEPVVLLHGFPQRASSWARVEPLLHEAGLRTLAPDQRGYSRGARPWGRWAYTVDKLVGDVRALVDHAGGPVHLVGHDWGAVVAWALAGRHPELLRTLTTVSVPHPRAYLSAMVHGRQLRRSAYVGVFNVPFLVELMAARDPERLESWLARSGMTPEMLADFRRDIVADGALTGGLSWYRALPLTLPGRGVPGRITVPTTHVWSTRDGALDRVGAERCGDWVDADYRLEVLEGVTHWIPEQAPQELARIVLERVASGEPT